MNVNPAIDGFENLVSASGKKRGNADMATMIVAPDLDVPGNTAAPSWAAATAKTTGQEIKLSNSRPLRCRSTKIKTNPPIIRARATGRQVVGSSIPILSRKRPPIAVTRKATRILKLNAKESGLRQSSIIFKRSLKSGRTAKTAPL